jgi:hypothetical protein
MRETYRRRGWPRLDSHTPRAPRPRRHPLWVMCGLLLERGMFDELTAMAMVAESTGLWPVDE